MFGSFLPSLGRQQPKSTRVEGADIVYAIKSPTTPGHVTGITSRTFRPVRLLPSAPQVKKAALGQGVSSGSEERITAEKFGSTPNLAHFISKIIAKSLPDIRKSVIFPEPVNFVQRNFSKPEHLLGKTEISRAFPIAITY
jgi:hypothetical protein